MRSPKRTSLLKHNALKMQACRNNMDLNGHVCMQSAMSKNETCPCIVIQSKARRSTGKTSHKNEATTTRKALQQRPQIGPKSVQNRSKIDPGSALEPMSLATSILDRFGTVPGAILEPSWGPLGGQVGAKLMQKSIFGGLGRRSKTNLVFDTFQIRFLTHFGNILEKTTLYIFETPFIYLS